MPKREPKLVPEPVYDTVRVFNVKANMRIYYGDKDDELDIGYIYRFTKDVEDKDFQVKLPSTGMTPMVIFKYVPSDTTAIIYRGGKIVTSGSENTSVARNAIYEILDFIKDHAPDIYFHEKRYDSEFDDEVDPLNVSLMQAAVQAPFNIKLSVLAGSNDYSHYVFYEPELNPMLVWRGGILGPNITANISAYGKVIFNCKGDEDANKERIEKLWIEYLRPALERFKKEEI